MYLKKIVGAATFALLSCTFSISPADALSMTAKDGVIKGSYDPSESSRNAVKRKAKKQCSSKKFSFYGEKNQADGTVKFEMRCQ